MSRVGDLEDALVNRLAAATIGGSQAFATVRGFSGGYRPALRDAIKRERLPAAYVAFTEELTAPETSDNRRGARFVVLVATQMLRAGDDPRHGDADNRGAFELMDEVRAQLDLYEPPGDVQLYNLHEKFVEADDRVAIYESAYRAWPIFIIQSIPGGNTIIAPRMIGTAFDHIKFDPANGQYTLAGTGRPLRPLLLRGIAGILGYNVGSVVVSQLATNSGAHSTIPATQVTSTSDGGWRSQAVLIEDWCDVDDDAELIVPVQAAAAASGNVSLRVDWDLARDAATGIVEGSATNVVAGPTAAGGIAFLVAATIPSGTFAIGDCVSFAIQRMAASDANDTYTQDLLIARLAWINFRRIRL